MAIASPEALGPSWSSPQIQKISALLALPSSLPSGSPLGLVVGLPVYPDGAAHPFAARCQRFAQQLAGRTGLPVVLEDERYTSALAPESENLDAQAAAILLQGLLNAKVHSA